MRKKSSSRTFGPKLKSITETTRSFKYSLVIVNLIRGGHCYYQVAGRVYARDGRTVTFSRGLKSINLLKPTDYYTYQQL